MENLTAKQEKFCQNIIEGMPQCDAYRDAYDTKTEEKNTVDSNASQLMDNTKIAQRIKFLRDEVASRVIITAESLVNELEIVKTMTLTEQQKDYNNHIKAIQTQAKLLGLDVVKMDLSSKDGSMRPSIVINTQLKKQGE